jgi:malate synthase
MSERQRSKVGGVELSGGHVAGDSRVLTADALALVAHLTRRFADARGRLLERRREAQRRFDAGELPGPLPETAAVRESDWTVAPAPADLDDRRVEITGPAEPKMMINALNSGARVFMADFEDALSPPWTNVVAGQASCMDAVRRTLEYTSPEGKRYALGEELATLVVRPRGWHLEEAHARVDGRPVPASLFDFALYFHHNAHELVRRGSGPYFYLPKLENHLEARLWNEVFQEAQRLVGLPQGTIRATVLIETIVAAFEMDEILYELRAHAAGLNAGRWDYIFSIIKKFGHRPEFVLPDRAQVTMAVPFMRAYTEQLVRTCHRRQAHAIGGMAAFIPSRRDEAVNQMALARVWEDKGAEAELGFDGAWVAHPDLVPVVAAVFDERMGDRPHQKNRLPPHPVDPGRLLDVGIPGAGVTDAGVRGNVSVALQYIEAWLRGAGAVAINNLMEDTATAEIARAQLWQWIRHGTPDEAGRPVTLERVRAYLDSELAARTGVAGRWQDAAQLLDALVAAREFPEFLTLMAYRRLEGWETPEG